MRITAKDRKDGKSFKVSKTDYLANLCENSQRIDSGIYGIYISPEVDFDGQKLWFPIISIDGQGLTFNERLQSAMDRAKRALEALDHLGAIDRFTLNATGKGGFKLVGDFLLNADHNEALKRFFRTELNLDDISLLGDQTSSPEALFVFHGNLLHATEDATLESHSVVVDKKEVLSGIFTADAYHACTQGLPNSEDYQNWCERILTLQQVSDLGSLGNLGKKIDHWNEAGEELNLKPFSFVKIVRATKTVSMEVVEKKLNAKEYAYQVGAFGDVPAILFKNRPCPSCGDKGSNAWAKSPDFTLKCRRNSCAASKEIGGLPLYEWLDSDLGRVQASSKATDTLDAQSTVTATPNYLSKKEAKKAVRDALRSEQNTLLVVTPGIGKTHLAIDHVVGVGQDKKIIFSCRNNDLKDESYKKCKDAAGGFVHVFNLQSMGRLCSRKEDIEAASNWGYSVSRRVCRYCPEKTSGNCDYQDQRSDQGNGIYFVNHHMLPYLPGRLKNPDLLIIDEDIAKVLLQEKSSTENELRTLLQVLPSNEARTVERLLDFTKKLADEASRDGSLDKSIINARKMSSGEIAEDTILSMLARLQKKSEAQVEGEFKAVVDAVKDLEEIDLYNKGVRLKVIDWISGLYDPGVHSFIRLSRLGKNNSECITFVCKKLSKLDFEDTTIKILDATGDKKLIESALKRDFDEVVVDVEWHAKKIHLKKSISRKFARRKREKDYKRILNKIIPEIDGTNVLVITYKEIKQKVVDLCGELAPDKSFKGHHFQAARGINKFETCDSVLVFGLPYENLDSAYHDAHIFFPADSDDMARIDYVYKVMEWELVQLIHRVRFVNKDEDNPPSLVICADHWPSCLPEADELIDQSRNDNWEQEAIKLITPFVEEFGFFNVDMSLLAGVVQIGKEKTYGKYRGNIKYLKMSETARRLHELKCIDPTISCCLPRLEIHRNFINKILKGNSQRCLLVLNNNIHLKTPLKENHISRRITSLIPQEYMNEVYQPLQVTRKQMGSIREYFQNKYPSFGQFKLPLKHAAGNKTDGVGNKEDIVLFYRGLNELEIFGETNIENLEFSKNFTTSNPETIPEDIAIIRIAKSGLWHVVCGEETIWIKPGQSQSEVGWERFIGIINETSPRILTDDGKEVAKHLIESGVGDLKIEDIYLRERLIRSDPKLELNSEYFIDAYEGLSEETSTGKTRELYTLWKIQEELISRLNMEKVVELEMACIWGTAKQELNGFQIDVDGLNAYAETLRKTMTQDTEKAHTDELTEIAKIVSRIDESGSYHDNLSQYNSSTGRYKSEIHNVRKPDKSPIREFFIAKPGYKLLRADYANFEVRAMAALSCDARLIQQFKAGIDPYVQLAMDLSGLCEKEAKTFRKEAKDALISFIYGAMPWSTEKRLREAGLPLNGTRFETLFANIHKWRQETINQMRNEGFLQTRLGRRFVITESMKTNTMVHFPIQGNACDGFKMALVDLHEQLNGYNAKVVHVQHDEVLVECAEEETRHVSVVLQETMEGVFTVLIPEVPFKAEVEVRDSWAG